MNETSGAGAVEPNVMAQQSGASAGGATIREIFGAFLLLGSTSFGTVVPYLRTSLVTKHGWLDDDQFVELLSISQTLPGLNATNMSVLVGQRLRGVTGAIAALAGMCLPGALIMFAVGVVYGRHGDRPNATAMLHGVAAAVIGLLMATILQLGRKTVRVPFDLLFIALPVIGVTLLHQPVPRVLLCVGAIAIFWHRPRATEKERTSP